ncbi:RelA/SpoT family protein [Nocardiopsis potens]|uniref:RelA/SpoT family protein n=1 Tax=Nocardiopsis potens TaxID=1246458 RepID=UPI00034CF5C0|nr:HD domain-containing protein [Nocardiopsis potens]
MASTDLTASSEWWRGLNAAFAARGPADPEARRLVAEHLRWYPRADAALLGRAYSVAEYLHREQRRKSGEPYITHPLAVAMILAEMGLDTATLVAALLHDTVEDTPFSLPHLGAEFGPEVAVMVDGVTKVDKVEYGEAAKGETIRKMVLGAREDLRVLLIKLADRLHNLRTLQFQPPHKRIRISEETRHLLIPLAERLGVYRIKRELEDLCFAYLEPEAHEAARARVEKVRYEGEELGGVHTVRRNLRDALSEFRVRADVEVRDRHLYSVHTSGFGERIAPLDTVRFLVVVRQESDAYLALGAVHRRWQPQRSRFRDFIAVPKFNLYKALHTSVHTGSGPMQVIICDTHSQLVSDLGIVAEIRQGTGRDGRLTRERTTDPDWLTRLLGWQDRADAQELLRGMRTDLVGSITVVTTDGRVLTLPEHSTPVDAAYALGPDVGNRFSAAMIAGRFVPPSHALRDGDTVQVITKAFAGPDEAWLESAKTGEARMGITTWHRERRREEDEEAGRSLLAGIIGLGPLIDAEASGEMTGVARAAGHIDLEDLYVALGRGDGEIGPDWVADRLRGQRA